MVLLQVQGQSLSLPVNLPLLILLRCMAFPRLHTQPFPRDLPHVRQALLHPFQRLVQPSQLLRLVQILACRKEGACLPSCSRVSAGTLAAGSAAMEPRRISLPWRRKSVADCRMSAISTGSRTHGLAGFSHEIACNTLPCSYTRAGLPTLETFRHMCKIGTDAQAV